MSYNEKILNYYNDRKNIGNFLFKKNLGSSLIGAPICGDLIELHIYVINDFVVDCKYKTYGCASAIASISLIVSYIKYKNINSVLFLKNTQISKELKLPLLKIHCSVLVEDVLNLSIINFKNNYLVD